MSPARYFLPDPDKEQHSMVHRAVAFALFACFTAIATGCADQPGRPPAVHHPLMYSTYAGDVVTQQAPPPFVIEPVQSRRSYVWAHSYWRWDGHGYVSVPGQWIPEKPDYRYVDATWEQHRDGWHFRPGHWVSL
jgi:hypothetical protein